MDVRAVDPVRRTMRLSTGEGLFQAVMVGVGESFFVPYALHLGAGNHLLGFLVAVPMISGALVQLLTERALHLLGSRRRLLCLGAGIQVLVYPPLLLLPALPGELRFPLLLALAAIHQSAGLLIGPAWNSLMGDIVPEGERGDYFSRRNRALQAASFLSLPAAGAILWRFEEQGSGFRGFVWIFLLAAAARAVSLALMALHWEPGAVTLPTPRTLSIITETLRKPDWRVLVFYIGLMSFAVNLSAPYFTAYMLRPPEEHGLGLSYVAFTAVSTITVLFKWLFLPVWGRATDRFGARKCLVLAGWLVGSQPLFWIVPAGWPEARLTALCVAQAWGGFVWAGHELSWFHFLLDSAPGATRPRLVASVNMLNGLMVFAGSTLGAVMVSAAPPAVNAFLFIFGLSAIIRFGVCGALLGRLREVRIAESISYTHLFFRLSSMRSQAGFSLRFFVLPAERRRRGRDADGRGGEGDDPGRLRPAPAPSPPAPGDRRG
ncbi:MAG TPA: MFS transporter [Candidatus Polarisedimenticolia bacterium]|nr:MFS transporter [Candidatus Polarisedimenticolia bacterium]